MKLIPFDRLKPDKGINYCRDHLRRKVKGGAFPKPIELSDRRIAWREDEIDDWLASRPRRNSGDRLVTSPPLERGSASPKIPKTHRSRRARASASAPTAR